MKKYSKLIDKYYCKPLKLLKLRGKIANIDVDKILIYSGSRLLGHAISGIYTYKPLKTYTKNQTIWVFTKVVSKIRIKKVLDIKMYDAANRLVHSEKAIIDIKNDIPKQYVSVIGTKDGITVNKNESVFIKEQVESEFKPQIKQLNIEPSSLCNLRCRYCIVSNNYDRIERGLISDEVLSKAIKAVNELRPSKLLLNGLGEPLMHPGFCNILQRIYSETDVHNVKFFTNGMLLTKEVSDRLATIPLNLNVTFSIDGCTPAENNFYRTGSDYEKVKKNIYYFLEQIKDKKNFEVRIHNLLVVKSDKQVTPPRFLLEDFGSIVVDTHRAFYFPDLSKEMLDKDNIKMFSYEKKKICKRTFGESTIRSNGDIIRCHWDSSCQVVLGNVLEKDLYDIWYGEKYIEQRKLMLPNSPFDRLPPVCQRCHAMNEGYLRKR